MGCFEILPIPWRKEADLTGDSAGPHLAENFRELDRWANTLHDTCGTADPARARGGFFGATIDPGDTATFEDANLGGGGSAVRVDGDMTYDGSTGNFIVPRDGLYVSMLQVEIDGTGLADPYWVEFVAGNAGDTRLLAPYSSIQPYVVTAVTYRTAGQGLLFQIVNSVTGSDSIVFSLGNISIAEVSGSTIEGAS